MHYPDGQAIRLGDRMALRGQRSDCRVLDRYGRIFADYRREHWAYLHRSILVTSDKPGLVHCTETEGEMRLLARSKI